MRDFILPSAQAQARATNSTVTRARVMGKAVDTATSPTVRETVILTMVTTRKEAKVEERAPRTAPTITFRFLRETIMAESNPVFALPPHERLRACLRAWQQMDDEYVVSVIKNGLKLSWVSDFDPESPRDSYRPKWGRNPPDLPDVVEQLIQEQLKTG